jgi:hypothetical protein
MSNPTNAETGTGKASGPAAAGLMPLIMGFVASRMVFVAAELRIADLLAKGPKTSEVLAAETGTHAPSLHRMLRALASFGVFEEVESGRFSLTTLGDQLRAGVTGSLRNFALMFANERSWRCAGEMMHSIRTGEPTMQLTTGMSGFQYLATHPEEARIFNEAMAEVTRRVAKAVVATYDISQFEVIIDVGGGNGTLGAVILAAFPNLRGIVLDLPAGCADAPSVLSAAGVADRCSVVAGDFFVSVPHGADICILKNVIHNWDDERSVTILRNCRTALRAGGKLLVIDRVMPLVMKESPVNRATTILDMRMLTMVGGRERTEAEYETLLAASGFGLARVLPLPDTMGVSIIEAVPAG